MNANQSSRYSNKTMKINNNTQINNKKVLEKEILNFKPILTYNSADLNKAEIIGENRKKAGVYR